MSRNLLRVVLCFLLPVFASGCVELNQIITLNPDGRGKVKYDFLMPADMSFGIGDPNGKDKTLDDKKRDALQKFLKQYPSATAWKDVSVEWSPDGRIHLVATAYFDNLDDMQPKSEGFSAPAPYFKVSHPKKGTLKIAGKTDANKGKDPAPPGDFKKMSDKELDDYILLQRVQFQGVKPLFIAMFTDMKINLTIRLPGEMAEHKGFKKEGMHVVAWKMDGNEMLGAMKKFMAMDNAAMRKLLREGNEAKALEQFGMQQLAEEPHVTVHDLKQQFDYAQEVEQARAAYPKMRKQLGLDESVRLPGEQGK